MLKKHASRTVDSFAGLHVRSGATHPYPAADDFGMARQTPASRSELPESSRRR